MNPVLIEIGGYSIRYYGLMYAIGILIAYQILKKDLKRLKLKLTEDDLFNFLFATFLGGLVGARLYYVLFNLDYYTHPTTPSLEFLRIWHGGLAIHGGLILGPLTLWGLCRLKRVSFAQLSDMAAPPLLLAQAIGRIGNLMNGDAHGIPTDLPWGLVFKHGPAAREFPGIALHPVMIYEALLNLVGFFILSRLKLKDFSTGFITCLYVIFYAAIRFYVSFFRADDLYAMGISAPHAFSIAAFAIALVLILGFKLYLPKKDTRDIQYVSSRKWTL